MPVVDVAAVGGARKLLGFSRRSVEIDNETVASLLQRLKLLRTDRACPVCLPERYHSERKISK